MKQNIPVDIFTWCNVFIVHPWFEIILNNHKTNVSVSCDSIFVVGGYYVIDIFYSYLSSLHHSNKESLKEIK